MRSVFAGLSALILSSTMAMADVITNYSPTFTQASFDSSGNLTIDLPQFNPALGALLGETLSFIGITGPQLEVLNLGDVAGTGVGSTSVTYTLSGNGANLTETASSGQQTVSVAGGFRSLNSSLPNTVGFSLGQNSGLTGLSGSGDLAFVLNELFTSSGTTITQGASLAFGGVASSNFGLSITYDYLAVASVPEPMSVAIFGAGLVGLAKIRRRRQS
jgi:hypothetical protein